MDAKMKKSCPNCSQFYCLKSLSPQTHGNVPLFLKCGHSICENCIRNIVQFMEPIECKVCHKDTELPVSDIELLLQNKISIYQQFPVNIYMLGEIALDLIKPNYEKGKINEPDYFIDLQSIIRGSDTAKGQCLECQSPTSLMCKQCENILCNNCFNKIHKNFVVFKNHALQNIETVINPMSCKIHSEKPLDYYCNDCSRSICMDCFMVGGDKSCKNHNVVSIQEVNEGFLQDLSSITPRIDETYRRLTKTAVDIGNLLYNIDNSGVTSEFNQVILNMEQHFSKLTFEIQKHKKEVIDIILKLRHSEKESLESAKNDVIKALKNTIDTLKVVNSLDENNMRQANVCAILEQAKKVADIPWYLDRDDTNKDPLKVTVNEDLSALMNDYIHLEGNAKSKYKLFSTDYLNENNIEIPPPPAAAVHPPELPKDVRQKNKSVKGECVEKPALYTQVPKFRSKSGSCSSLSSVRSDGSNKSFGSCGQYQRPLVQQVNPFLESRPPQQLREGAQELIYISHIVNPHNFFVQRALHQPQVEELLREFRNAVSLPKPSSNHVAEGKFYLVFTEADNMWQRCRVISINRRNKNNPIFNVFCIDFGSTEFVSIDKLRLLPPARLQSPFPFAINCSLANCEPMHGAWTTEDSLLVQKIVDNKQAVIYIRHIRSTSNYSVTCECDVTTYEDDVNLAHALAFQERARLVNSKLQCPKLIAGSEKPVLHTNNNDFKRDTVEEVYITHIVSPDNFFVRKHHVQKIYEKLCKDLDLEYSLSTNTGVIYLPQVGMVCVVKVEGVVRWARGVVRELPGRGRVRVWLPDAGALLLVHWTALRRIQPKFTTLRALAVECHLAGVTPLNIKWSPRSVNLLQQFENRLLELHVEDNRNRGSLGVVLYDTNDPDDIICVNTEMIKHKFAISLGFFMFNKNNDKNGQVLTNKSPLDEPKHKLKPKENTVKILKKQQPPKVNEDDLEAKDKGPLRLEARILNYQSPSLFYVSLIIQQKTFNELFDKMQKYYSKRRENVQGKHWEVGDRCCAICNESQTWRRATIVEIQEEKAKLFFSDFACVGTVLISGLRELTKDFASIGDAAFKCHLCGVIPAIGEEWPSLTKEFLKELIDAYNRFFITKIGNFKDKSMPVELWVYHTIQGDALEPNVSEWRCLNKRIIEQGLGIPDKSQVINDPLIKSTNCDDSTLSFLNITGSVNEWLQLEQLPTKPLEIKYETDATSNPSSPIEQCLETKHEQEGQSSSTISISDWLPPEPLSSDEFNGMPTYIDNDGVIYLHALSQQDTLDLIRKALDVRFKNPDPKAKFVKWAVGEPCVALFFLDNRFYRGKVLEVNNDSSTCLIHYIDYGNEEICSFTSLRKSIALHQIPAQARKCILDRIQPVDKQWDRQTLDYIHKSIVEKKCYIKVTGPAVRDVTPIELKFDKLWINDHLVEFEMAEYTDGTKAVIHKFVPNTDLEESITVESDSGPDYIVENQSNDSFNEDPIKRKDWNTLMEEEDEQQQGECDEHLEVFPDGKFVMFLKENLDSFLCNITIINDPNTLELNILRDEDQSKLYDNMFKKLQMEGESMEPLNGIYENKACIAIFPDDNQWYRASILQFSMEKNRIKVRYIDYGNIEIISLADVREITEDFSQLPPATVTATLHGVKINSDVELSVITEEYTNTFIDKGPFHVKIIDFEDCLPQVELRNSSGALVYEELIKKNIFLEI